jgi:hypothetical protein
MVCPFLPVKIKLPTGRFLTWQACTVRDFNPENSMPGYKNKEKSEIIF